MIIACGFSTWFIREKELRTHEELRVKEMQPPPEMKELEIELED